MAWQVAHAAHALAVMEAKFRWFQTNVAEMDKEFEQHFHPLASTQGKPLSRCGDCGRFMKHVRHKPQRLHCGGCDKTWALPQGGTIKLYMNKTCPICRFELVFFSLGNTAPGEGGRGSRGGMGKSYPLCPKCYNEPPFEDMLLSGAAGGAGEGERRERGAQRVRLQYLISVTSLPRLRVSASILLE